MKCYAIEWTGKRIKALREANGLSQLQLATNADIDVSYIGQIERKGMNITIESLSKICKVLGLSIEEFFVGCEDFNKTTKTGTNKHLLKEITILSRLKSPKIQKLLLELLKESK